MTLAAVRTIGSPRALRTAQEVEDFEQEIVDQYAPAMAAAGLSDGHVSNTRAVIIEFARSLPGALWSASCDDADRLLAEQRKAVRAVSTRAGKAGTLALFFELVISRYQGDIHALTGVVVDQPIDEFNRQSGAPLGKVRVPPSEAEVEELFAGKMSSLWAGMPKTIRLDDLDVICAVLSGDPAALLIREPENVAARRPSREQSASAEGGPSTVSPRFGKPKSEPPL
jgi:hypothetical protein